MVVEVGFGDDVGWECCCVSVDHFCDRRSGVGSGKEETQELMRGDDEEKGGGRREEREMGA